MARPANQPSALDFRQGSTDRDVITQIERAQTYGLITNWLRSVSADEKVTYSLAFPDGEIEQMLKPRDTQMLLSGLMIAHRLHVRGNVVDIAKKGN